MMIPFHFQMNQKGSQSLFATLGEIVLIVILVLVIASLFISGTLFDLFGILGGNIERTTADSDSDGIHDLEDKCPCTYGVIENEAFPGCPRGYAEADVIALRPLYNTDTGCGELIFDDDGDRIANVDDRCSSTALGADVDQEGERRGCAADQEPDQLPEEVEARFRFTHYRSIELFGSDDGGADDPDPANDQIRAACIGWVGQDCASEDDDCDGEFHLEPLETTCWVMASEDDDIDGNDCGQARVDEGTIIPVEGYASLGVDITNTYLSIPEDEDPQNLFSWSWQSKPEYGSLICNNGFWVGCKTAGEGRELVVDEFRTYRCRDGAWERATSTGE